EARSALRGRGRAARDRARLPGRAGAAKGEPLVSARPSERQLHGMLVAELSAAGCFRRAQGRSIAYGAFILTAYTAAYCALLMQPGIVVRALAIVVLAALCMHGGFL